MRSRLMGWVGCGCEVEIAELAVIVQLNTHGDSSVERVSDRH